MKSGWRTFIAYSIPVLILSVSLVVMNLQPTRMENEQFMEHTRLLEAQIKSTEWDKALSELKATVQLYDEVRPRIQFSMERNKLDELEVAFARLQAYLMAEDQGGSLASTLEARQHWVNLRH